jgi:hypothetical protein
VDNGHAGKRELPEALIYSSENAPSVLAFNKAD